MDVLAHVPFDSLTTGQAAAIATAALRAQTEKVIAAVRDRLGIKL